MADEKEVPEQPPKGSNKKLIIFGLLGLILVGGGAGGAAYYLGAKSSGAEVSQAGEGEAQQLAEALPEEALYVALDPAFTVNFADEGEARFLQLSLQAMTRHTSVADSIADNMPMIRNNLVLILSSKSSVDLESPEGKEQLREETRAGIQDVISREGAEGDVEAVFFTSFVMQ